MSDRDEIFNTIVKICRNHMNGNLDVVLDEDTELTSINMIDSLDKINIIVDIEQCLDLDISSQVHKMFNAKNIKEMVDIIHNIIVENKQNIR